MRRLCWKKHTSPPSLQDVHDTIETSYACNFHKPFLNDEDFLGVPIGTASVEHSFNI